MCRAFFINKLGGCLWSAYEEAAKITVDVVGFNINNLSFNIKGPEEIVEKINAAFAGS